jgi:SAM-dependent methyltransferase
MKVCLQCGAQASAVSMQCPRCGHSPATIDGFPAYAPELASAQEGYLPEFYAEYAHLEANHFWFSVRCRLIVWALRKYGPGTASMLEIGAGTGYVLEAIAKAFPAARLHGSEMLTTGLRFSADRLPSATFLQMDARRIPYADEFDAIGAFDVVEHIDDDTAVLRQAHAALKANGLLLLTVPQHPWLWSSIDEYSFHVRRYTAHDLHAKVEAAGFEILRSTSFVSVLLPAMALSRFVKRDAGAAIDPLAELKISPLANRVLKLMMSVESWLIRLGINFPMGGSRLVVARKTPT